MGIPYSRQINSAFDQVTPLVAAGFEVLQTTKNVAILAAAIQVLTVIILTLILGVLMALLIAINPDTAEERKEIVTPVVKSLACLLMPECKVRSSVFLAATAILGIVFASVWAFYGYATDVKDISAGEYADDGGTESENQAADTEVEK
jgi:hypothetical protein